MKISEYKSIQDFSNIDLTPKNAIMLNCVSCCCYEPSEAKRCTDKHCPLWRISRKYFGIIKTQNKLSEEQKELLRTRLEIARARKSQN